MQIKEFKDCRKTHVKVQYQFFDYLNFRHFRSLHTLGTLNLVNIYPLCCLAGAVQYNKKVKV